MINKILRPSVYIFILILALFLIILPQSAKAAVTFDPTFGTAGQVITSFGNEANTARIAIQSDGKIIVVGRVSNGTNDDWAVVRYNSDGSLDTTFGTGGKVIKDFGFGNDALNTVAIQTDGKIVVGGHSRGTTTTCSNNPNFVHTVCWTVARYNTDGSLDSSFGNGGVVFSSVRDGTDPEVVSRLTLQADGKIVAVGNAYDLGVVRYNTDGSEDFRDLIVIPNSFSDPPTFFPNAPAGELGAGASAVRIQQDGKILIAGSAGNHMFLLRLHQNNSFDTMFGVGGLRRVSLAPVDFSSDMVLQPDGSSIVVGGLCDTGDCSNGLDTFVARFLSNSNSDSSFGSGGSVITNFSAGNDLANAVVIEQNNKIIAGGTQASNWALYRFNTDGTLDASFGTNGIFTPAVGQGGFISDVALQTDNKLLAAGSASNGSYNDWGIARFSGLSEPVTTTFNSSADSYVRSGGPNRNLGAGDFMRLQASGDNRSLVRFDQSAMQSEIGTKEVLSAKLRVTITNGGTGWGSTGRTIDAHRLLANWTEGNGTENDQGTGAGLTWNCAIDSNIDNSAKNCSGTTEWEMGQPNNPSVHPWAQTATATQTITNNQSGVVEFDVTADVANFLNGTNQNYGWLIKKTDEGQSGNVSFGTKESSSVPQLVVTYQP